MREGGREGGRGRGRGGNTCRERGEERKIKLENDEERGILHILADRFFITTSDSLTFSSESLSHLLFPLLNVDPSLEIIPFCPVCLNFFLRGSSTSRSGSSEVECFLFLSFLSFLHWEA